MTAALQPSNQAPPVRLSNCRRRNGTAEPTLPDMKPVLLIPDVQPQHLYRWLDELDYWQLEVSFYHKLLTIEIYMGKPCKRVKLDEVLNAFAAYKHEILPDMKAALEKILADNPVQNGLHPSAFQREMERHTETLRKLKLEVFPCLSELLTVTIW